MNVVSPNVTRQAMRSAEYRAEMYRRFIPGWPALAETFEREAKRLAAALATKAKP